MGSRNLVMGMLVLVILLLASNFAEAAGSHLHSHQQAHNHGHLHARNNKTSFATALVEEALSALALVNKARIERPRFNKYEFNPGSAPPALAPALDPSAIVSNSSSLRRRQLQGNSTDDVPVNNYSISPELAEAAKILAESTPQSPKGNHSDVARAMRKKYAHNTNDTNTPDAHKTPEGRLSIYGDDASAQKRADEWWMVAMGPSGASPFAPEGYKVSLVTLMHPNFHHFVTAD